MSGSAVIFWGWYHCYSGVSADITNGDGFYIIKVHILLTYGDGAVRTSRDTQRLFFSTYALFVILQINIHMHKYNVMIRYRRQQYSQNQCLILQSIFVRRVATCRNHASIYRATRYTRT